MTSSIDLLVVGGSGFVGAHLVRSALRYGYEVAYTYSRHRLQLSAASFQVDFLDDNSIDDCLAQTQPKIIVYCAVPRGDETTHRLVSVEGVKRTLNALDKSLLPKFIYVSTNAVFSGQRGRYREVEKPDAEQRRDGYRAYAVARSMGEQVLLDTWPNSIIVRTADVNGRDLQGNINTRLANLIDQLKSSQQIQRLSQAYISPTLVDNLVDGMMEILEENFAYRGILHIAGCERITYYEFTRTLAKFINADVSLIKPDESKVWDYSLEVAFTQSLLKTRLLNVDEQFSGIFSQ